MDDASLPPHDAEQLMALQQAIVRSDGFALLIARVNLPADRTALLNRLRAGIGDEVEIQDVVLDAPITDLTALLSRLPPATGRRRALSVVGLELSIPSAAARHPVLSVLNLKRELLRDTVPHPLVLWLPEYAVRAVAEGAPDFWAWRSAVLDFTPRADDVDRLWETERSGGSLLEYGKLSVSERRERLRSLTGLLEEYDARPDADAKLVEVQKSLLDRIARLHLSLYAYDDALACYERWRNLAVQTLDSQDEAAALHQIGVIHEDTGDLDSALRFFQKSLEISRHFPDHGSEAATLHHIGRIHHSRLDLDVALRFYHDSLNIAKHIGDQNGESAGLHQIGMIHQERGDLDSALDFYQQSLTRSREISNRRGEAGSLHQIGRIHQDRGDLDVALDFYQQSLDRLVKTGNRSEEAISLHQIGRIHQERGDLKVALDFYQKSLEIKRKIGDRSGEARALYVMGILELDCDDPTTAFAHLTTALKITPSFETRLHDAILIVLGRLRQQWGVESFDAAWHEQVGGDVPPWAESKDDTDPHVSA